MSITAKKLTRAAGLPPLPGVCCLLPSRSTIPIWMPTS